MASAASMHKSFTQPPTGSQHHQLRDPSHENTLAKLLLGTGWVLPNATVPLQAGGSKATRT